MSNNYTPQFLSDLRRGIAATFNSEDLKNLCVDLGVEYENLGGEGREGKIRELIIYLDHRGRLSELVARCGELRANYAWPTVGGAGPSPARVDITVPGEGKIRILFLAADPSDQSRLRLGTELREIGDKLQRAKLRERFDLQERLSVRPADVSQALLDLEPQIVHFAGHGTSIGTLCLENEFGETQPVTAAAIAALFEQFAAQVQCVILNACYTEVQARAIAKHIGYVIGMKQDMGDQAAIAFAIGFYQALGAGRSIEDAYKLGRVQIALQGIPEELTPVLIKK